MHIFGWKEGQFQDLTDAWLPGDMRHFEGIGEFVPGDFNNDDRTDLFLAGYADMDHFVQPYALINEGEHFSRQALPEVIGWQHGAGAGDINGDGYDDVYAAGYGYEPPVSRRMYWGEEDGLKEAEFKQDADGSGLTLADFLGDGSVTAMVVDSGVEGSGTADGGTVLARIEETPDGDASIEVISRLPPPLLDSAPEVDVDSHDLRVEAIDFSRDGLMDAIVFARGSFLDPSASIQFLRNDGNGEFTDVTQQRLETIDYRGVPIYAPNIADFDRDGRADIYVDGVWFEDDDKPKHFLMQDQDGVFIERWRDELTATAANSSDGGFIQGPEGEYWQEGTTPEMDRMVKGPDEVYSLVRLATGVKQDGRIGEVSIADVDFPYRDEGEVLQASPAVDTIHGMGGDDRLVAAKGSDTLDGGTGIDTAVYAGSADDYEIEPGSTEFQVSPVNGGAAWRDTLIDVERLEFSDVTLAHHMNDHPAMATRLYQAAFDRLPDSSGLGYWVNRLDDGTDLERAAAEFIGSPEFSDRYGASPTNDEYIDALYANVLDRLPDADGKAYWLNRLETDLDRDDVLSRFSESAENQDNTAAVIAAGIEYRPWESELVT
ncbi:hypothetical protein BA897_09825 [Spiribacter roseus]|nr:hypothetical protein BA897_09825 [Spiribacter roseus]